MTCLTCKTEKAVLPCMFEGICNTPPLFCSNTCRIGETNHVTTCKCESSRALYASKIEKLTPLYAAKQKAATLLWSAGEEISRATFLSDYTELFGEPTEDIGIAILCGPWTDELIRSFTDPTSAAATPAE